MRIKDFIKKTIKDLTEQFDNIQCSYRYDAFIDTHYIEVLPNDTFNNSDELTEFRSEIYDIFDEKYPADTVAFISDHSLIKIGTPEYVLAGKNYCKEKNFDTNWFKTFNKSVHGGSGSIIKASDNNYALAA